MTKRASYTTELPARRPIALAVRCAVLAGAAAVGSLPALAQDAGSALDEVIVTGSRIPRANLTAPTAVTTIDAAVISQSGLTNVADVLRSVPSFGVPALSRSNSNFFTTSGGINTLQLRNLEEDRTLVLVNGRRYISGIAGSAAVDFNTIPVELVERIEIITGGASAIYGSDALAGVINVTLKKDFEGVKFGYQYGEATAGGEIENRATFTAGGNFADARGNAVLSASYTEQRGLLSRQRKNTRVDDISLCFLTDDPADCDESFEPFFSSFSERGRFFVPSLGTGGGSRTLSDGTGPTGTVVPFSTAQHGFNRQQFRRYTVPTERYLLSGLMDYDLGGGVKAFMELTFAQTRTTQELEPFPHSNSDLSINGIPLDNPFVPQAIRDFVTAAQCDADGDVNTPGTVPCGDTEVAYFRRMTEVGQRGAFAKRNTYRLLGGLEGEIADKWKWESYYSFGRMDDSQQGGGQINVPNMREALNVIDGDGDPNTFDPVCANPTAIIEGCVPINLFGLGSISPEAADYVRAPTSRQQLTQQQVAGAEFGGPLFNVPAGSVDFAAGVEYRRERAEDVPDVLTQSGQNASNKEAPTFGSYNVKEAFAEVEVPLLRDLPGVHELSIGGAYRFSDYSTVGNTDAYTGRISWAPIESLRFRGQYARAVRAPNIGELFAPGGENFAPVSDPCNNITAATPGDTATNCRSIQAIAARIAATGSFTLTQPEIQGTGGFTGKGNPLLNAETSNSYSLGAVFDQELGKAGALTLSVDYFDIEIKKLIDTVGRQTALNFCFNTDPSNFPNQFCSFLTRDTTGGVAQIGELLEVNSGFVNEGKLETNGIDVSLLWRWDMSEWAASIPGQVALRLNYTHLVDYTETKFGVKDSFEGEVGFAENKGQTAVVYTAGPWNVQWEWSYIDDSVPDNDDEFFNFSVGSFSTHDVQVSYDFGSSKLMEGTMFEGARIYVGANNVFDEEAPNIFSGSEINTTGTDTAADVYDPIGRTWYLGVNFSF